MSAFQQKDRHLVVLRDAPFANRSSKNKQADHAEVRMMDDTAQQGSQVMATVGAGVIASKVLMWVIALAFLLVTVVVMVFTKPRSTSEMVVALISTLCSCLGIGSAIIAWFHLQNLMTDMFGIMATGALFFFCGLPGWVLVRASFAWSEKNKDAGLPDLIRETRDSFRD